MFWKTQIVTVEKDVVRTVSVPVEKIVKVKDPLNTDLMAAHTALLTEHRLLLDSHKHLIQILRETPHWASPSQTPLYVSEDEEDAQFNGTHAPKLAAVPNPFDDLREDEEILRNLGLSPNIST